MQIRYHLTGKGHSGRAVDIEPLEPDEAEQIQIDAAKIVGPEATILDLKKTEWRTGARRMTVKFSEPTQDPKAEGLKWTTMTPDHRDDWKKYFTTKDSVLLEAVYREYHDVSPGELAEITGKAVTLSEA